MKQYLIKQNRKTTDFVLLEADNKFVRKTVGKIGKSGIANSTLNAGTPEKAIEEISTEVKILMDKGYVLTELPKDIVTEDIIFDKAKWHINDKFPSDLDQYQSHVHTGLYICWLIDRNLIEQEFKNEFSEGIKLLTTRKINPSEFYANYLDGVFSSEGLNQKAIEFTKSYFDFESGKYLSDYLTTLDKAESLPTVFHIKDTWENYDKLKQTLNNSFDHWLKENLTAGNSG